MARLVAALDPLGQVDLLDGGEQRALRDVAQEELERVARGLGNDGGLNPHDRLVGAARGIEQLDAPAFSFRIERIQSSLLQLQLLDGCRHLGEIKGALLLSLVEERLERGVFEKSGHASGWSPGYAQR